MPEVAHFANEEELLENWKDFMKLRSDVLKALEIARNNKVIGKSFEAQVTLYPTKETKELLDKLNANIRQILIVSELTISDDEPSTDGEEFASGTILVEHAAGEVCPRCRRITTDVGSDTRFPELCARCAEIVAENYPEAVKEGFEE